MCDGTRECGRGEYAGKAVEAGASGKIDEFGADEQPLSDACWSEDDDNAILDWDEGEVTAGSEVDLQWDMDSRSTRNRVGNGPQVYAK